jgi:hypothetical protein
MTVPPPESACWLCGDQIDRAGARTCKRCTASIAACTPTWDAFFGVDRDGLPFIYDSNTGVKHVLPPQQAQLLVRKK